MSQTEKRIAIMQAAVDGKTIEYLDLKRHEQFGTDWREYPSGGCPQWQWMEFDYRVKPMPEFEWVNIYAAIGLKDGSYRGMWGAPHDTEAHAIQAATVASTGGFPKDYLGTLKVEVK